MLVHQRVSYPEMYNLTCRDSGPDGTIFIEVPEHAIWEPQSRCKIETSMTPGGHGAEALKMWRQLPFNWQLLGYQSGIDKLTSS